MVHCKYDIQPVTEYIQTADFPVWLVLMMDPCLKSVRIHHGHVEYHLQKYSFLTMQNTMKGTEQEICLVYLEKNSL